MSTFTQVNLEKYWPWGLTDLALSQPRWRGWDVPKYIALPYCTTLFVSILLEPCFWSIFIWFCFLWREATITIFWSLWTGVGTKSKVSIEKKNETHLEGRGLLRIVMDDTSNHEEPNNTTKAQSSGDLKHVTLSLLGNSQGWLDCQSNVAHLFKCFIQRQFKLLHRWTMSYHFNNSELT